MGSDLMRRPDRELLQAVVETFLELCCRDAKRLTLAGDDSQFMHDGGGKGPPCDTIVQRRLGVDRVDDCDTFAGRDKVAGDGEVAA